MSRTLYEFQLPALVDESALRRLRDPERRPSPRTPVTRQASRSGSENSSHR